jgi:hypothetical protein
MTAATPHSARSARAFDSCAGSPWAASFGRISPLGRFDHWPRCRGVTAICAELAGRQRPEPDRASEFPIEARSASNSRCMISLPQQMKPVVRKTSSPSAGDVATRQQRACGDIRTWRRGAARTSERGDSRSGDRRYDAFTSVLVVELARVFLDQIDGLSEKVAGINDPGRSDPRERHADLPQLSREDRKIVIESEIGADDVGARGLDREHDGREIPALVGKPWSITTLAPSLSSEADNALNPPMPNALVEWAIAQFFLPSVSTPRSHLKG